MNRITYIAAISLIIFAHYGFANASLTLWHAAKNGDVETIHKCFEKNADLNYFGEDGSTPLWQAASNGHAKAVELLLLRGADSLIIPILKGRTLKGKEAKARKGSRFPFLRQKSQSDGDLVRDSSPSFPPSSNNSKGKEKERHLKSPGSAHSSSLTLPLKGRSMDKETTLGSPKRSFRKSSGASGFNAPSPYELGLPIHIALRMGHHDVVKVLMEHGNVRQIETPDADLNTPVHLACIVENINLFNAVVNSPSKNVRALNAAIRIARMKYNRDGYLPIHLALRHGGENSSHMVDLLRRSGDDKDAPILTGRHQRPYDLAMVMSEGAVDKETKISLMQAILYLSLAGADPYRETLASAEPISTNESYADAAKLVFGMTNDVNNALREIIFDSGSYESMLKGLTLFATSHGLVSDLETDNSQKGSQEAVSFMYRAKSDRVGRSRDAYSFEHHKRKSKTYGTKKEERVFRRSDINKKKPSCHNDSDTDDAHDSSGSDGEKG